MKAKYAILVRRILINDKKRENSDIVSCLECIRYVADFNNDTSDVEQINIIINKLSISKPGDSMIKINAVSLFSY